MLLCYLSTSGWVQKNRFELSEMWVPGGSPELVTNTKFIESEGGATPWQFGASTHSACCHGRQSFTWAPAQPTQSLHLCSSNMAGTASLPPTHLSLNFVSEDEAFLFKCKFCLSWVGVCLSVCCLSLQVSMAVCCAISNEMAKSQPPQHPASAGSKKGKDKGKGKKAKDVGPIAQVWFIMLLTVSVCLYDEKKNSKAQFTLVIKT